MRTPRIQMVLAVIAGALSVATHASEAPGAWSISTGVAAPARAAALRVNPASVPGHGNAAQISGRYSTLTGGPISTVDALWDSSPVAFGIGGEYSLATKNPELHAGAGLGFGSHGVGLSATTRRTAARFRSSLGFSTYSKWSDLLATGVRFDGVGEGKEAMEMVAGAAFHGLPWSGSRLECDVAYGLGAKALTLRPAMALSLPFSFAGAVSLDLPLRHLGSYAAGLAIGYEKEKFGVQLRASTALEGGLDVMTRF